MCGHHPPHMLASMSIEEEACSNSGTTNSPVLHPGNIAITTSDQHDPSLSSPDPSDLLARLCSFERQRADDLPYWQSVLSGLEWAISEGVGEGVGADGQSLDQIAPEVEKVLQQYCRNFYLTAPKSGNMHTLLLVLSRHFEYYAQHLHVIASAASTGGRGSGHNLTISALSVDGGVDESISAAIALCRDHHWVSLLLFFLRTFVSFLLSHFNYDAVLNFFSHLAQPDHASKPTTPKTPRTPNKDRERESRYSNGENWNVNHSMSGSISASVVNGGISNANVTFLSPPNPGKYHAINLNPSSRRNSTSSASSSSSNADILTRFVCSLVNMLEVLGDLPLNQQLAKAAAAKPSSSSSSSPATPVMRPSMSGGRQSENGVGAGAVDGRARTGSRASASTIDIGGSPRLSSSGSSISGGSSKSLHTLHTLHSELFQLFFVLLSSQMYLPLQTDFEQIFLDRLMFVAAPPLLNSHLGFVTSLLHSFCNVLPKGWEQSLAQRRGQDSSGRGSGGRKGSSSSSSPTASFFSKLTSSLSSLLYFPVWAVRLLFSIPASHPLVDRSLILLELLVYQDGENEFRRSLRQLRNCDRLINRVTDTGKESEEGGSNANNAHEGELINLDPDYSDYSMLECQELGVLSFDMLYYALCSTLQHEHSNLLLYALLHENGGFKHFLLVQHAHDLDCLIMPQLEVLYKEVDISKHHVYMIINIWILLTQSLGFDHVITRIKIKEMPFFKERVLKDLSLSEAMQVVLLRTLQLNLRTKLREPHIFNNCLAAFCNLTITALVGAPPEHVPFTPDTSTSPPRSPLVMSSSSLALPLRLHPQVSFRLTRVLAILSRQFVHLNSQHSQALSLHNSRIDELELLESEDRLEECSFNDEEFDASEQRVDELAEQLGTCMEFLQLLLEVVNQAIVHQRPTPLAMQHHGATSSTSSLASNPHLLYNLIHAKDYFTQLLPHESLFESGLVANVTNAIEFFERALESDGVHIPTGRVARGAGAGGGINGKAGVPSEKEVEKAVHALARAIHDTPMSAPAQATTPSSTSASSSSIPALPSPPSSASIHPSPPPSPWHASASPISPIGHLSAPIFNPAALVERGPFTYHEQENSQDFFIPYIYQLAQHAHILPKLYAPAEALLAATTGNVDGVMGLDGMSGTNGQTHHLGDVNADELFVAELEEAESAMVRPSPLSSPLARFKQMGKHNMNGRKKTHDGEDESDAEPNSPAELINIAIK